MFVFPFLLSFPPLRYTGSVKCAVYCVLNPHTNHASPAELFNRRRTYKRNKCFLTPAVLTRSISVTSDHVGERKLLSKEVLGMFYVLTGVVTLGACFRMSLDSDWLRLNAPSPARQSDIRQHRFLSD